MNTTKLIFAVPILLAMLRELGGYVEMNDDSDEYSPTCTGACDVEGERKMQDRAYYNWDRCFCQCTANQWKTSCCKWEGTMGTSNLPMNVFNKRTKKCQRCEERCAYAYQKSIGVQCALCAAFPL